MNEGDRATPLPELDHMYIWKRVCATDPRVAKRVPTRGGFTAIDAQSQLKAATELFGPYGWSWGLRDLCWNHVEIKDEWWITLDATFYYELDPNMSGSFPISVDMPLDPHNDCRKKLLTEARSKALSLIGFNSDVFEGRFDDNKYVAAMTAKYGGEADTLKRAIVAAKQAIASGNEKKLIDVRQRADDLLAQGAITERTHAKILEACT